jgi:hypothetical protein
MSRPARRPGLFARSALPAAFVRALVPALVLLAMGAPARPAYAAPPPNDNFAAAEVITQASLPTNRVVDTTEATAEPNEPFRHGNPLSCATTSSVFGHSIWYRFTPTSRMQL